MPAKRLILLLGAVLGGCALGPYNLERNQVDYARALADARKSEILAMMVGLRYADAPSVLTLTQVIAAYTVDATGGVLVNSSPNPGGPHAGATGMISYSNRPTFTFTPTTGASYAKAYIQPLSLALIMPLANSGVPIDLLLRITVQSIGPLNNATMLGGPTGNGSTEFYELLQALRRLQLAGKVSIHYSTGSGSERVALAFMDRDQSGEDAELARRLLNLSQETREFELVSRVATTRSQLNVATRSVLAILSDLGAEIDVPEADVRSGTTQQTIGLAKGATRPVMKISSGKRLPEHAYASTSLHATQFWIDEKDFDSKYALTVVQEVMALAEVTDASRAPLVTVPAN